MIKVLSNGNENRKPGYDVAVSGESILAGQPLTLATSTGITKANGATVIIGFALENTVGLTDATQSYDQYNRGGKVSVVSGKGIELQVWDDGRGSIFNTALTYTLNQALYVSAAGLIDNSSTGGNVIGYVTKVPATPNDSLIFQVA
jgi:hypothetical protein